MQVLPPRQRFQGWDLVPTSANRMPTAASYLCRPGDSAYRAFKLDVLRIQDGVIAEITTFGPGLFPAFGLPPTLRYRGRDQMSLGRYVGSLPR